MFLKAGNLNVGMGMTTRSKSQAGMGFASRVQPMMQTMETSFGGSSAAMARNISSNNLTSPGSIPRNTLPSNLLTASPNTSIQFGRSYATKSTINNMESGHSAGAIPSRTSFATHFANPLYAGNDIDFGNSTLDASTFFRKFFKSKAHHETTVSLFLQKT